MKKLFCIITGALFIIAPTLVLISCGNTPKNNKIDTNLFEKIELDSSQKLKKYLSNENDYDSILDSSSQTNEEFNKIYLNDGDFQITSDNNKSAYNFLYDSYYGFVQSVNQQIVSDYNYVFNPESNPIKIDLINGFDCKKFKIDQLKDSFNALIVSVSPVVSITAGDFNENISLEKYVYTLTNNPTAYWNYIHKASADLISWLHEFIYTSSNILKIAKNSSESPIRELYKQFYVNFDDPVKNNELQSFFDQQFKNFKPSNGDGQPVSALMSSKYSFDDLNNVFDINPYMIWQNDNKYGKSLLDTSGFNGLVSAISNNIESSYIDSLLEDELVNSDLDYKFGSTSINLSHFNFNGAPMTGKLKMENSSKDVDFWIGMSKKDFDDQKDSMIKEMESLQKFINFSCDSYNYIYCNNRWGWTFFSTLEDNFKKMLSEFWNRFPDYKPTPQKAGLSFHLGTREKNHDMSHFRLPINFQGYGVYYSNSDYDTFFYISYGIIDVEDKTQINDAFLLSVGVTASLECKIYIKV